MILVSLFSVCADKTYNDFVEKLKEAEKKKQCRYAIFDVHFMQNDIPQEKIAFFLWSVKNDLCGFVTC